MAFANPFWLWGLTALSIPLAIHLLSRKEGKVISVGSLRHLKDANTQKFKSLRLNEVFLLILRCLLIILLVLFLSGLQLKSTTNQTWVIVEESLKGNRMAKSIIDSLTAQGYELHYYSEGQGESEFHAQSYWSLVEQLESKAISEAVVLSTSRAEFFKGIRNELPSSVTWITVPGSFEDFPVAATRKSKDSVTITYGSMHNSNTHYQTIISGITPNQSWFQTKTDSIHIDDPDTITISLFSAPDFLYDKQIVLAVLKAIQSNVPEKFIIGESSVDSVDMMIWLSNSPPQAKSEKLIYFKNSPIDRLFEQQSFSQWQLSKRLNEDIALNENLVIELAKIILPRHAQWKIANAKDQRVMPEEMMWSKPSGESDTGLQNASFILVDKYLIALIILVLIIERIVAFRRNQ